VIFLKNFFVVTVGGFLSVSAVRHAPEYRGGAWPPYPPFLEQLFGFLRVPWKSKKARTRRASLWLWHGLDA